MQMTRQGNWYMHKSSSKEVTITCVFMGRCLKCFAYGCRGSRDGKKNRNPLRNKSIILEELQVPTLYFS